MSILRDVLPALNSEEHNICRWFVEGKTRDQIAASLDIAPGTVDYRVGRLMRRYGVKTRVALFYRLGVRDGHAQAQEAL